MSPPLMKPQPPWPLHTLGGKQVHVGLPPHAGGISTHEGGGSLQGGGRHPGPGAGVTNDWQNASNV
jgi:hypothetical protein